MTTAHTLPAPLDTFWQLLCELAERTHAVPLNQHPGCWYIAIDAHWELAVNAQPRPSICNAFRSTHPIAVNPYHAYIEFNGWPAAILSPQRGEVAAGTAANITTLCAAIHDHIRGLA